jgi:hypothetical protein
MVAAGRNQRRRQRERDRGVLACHRHRRHPEEVAQPADTLRERRRLPRRQRGDAQLCHRSSELRGKGERDSLERPGFRDPERGSRQGRGDRRRRRHRQRKLDLVGRPAVGCPHPDLGDGALRGGGRSPRHDAARCIYRRSGRPLQEDERERQIGGVPDPHANARPDLREQRRGKVGRKELQRRGRKVPVDPGRRAGARLGGRRAGTERGGLAESQNQSRNERRGPPKVDVRRGWRLRCHRSPPLLSKLGVARATVNLDGAVVVSRSRSRQVSEAAGDEAPPCPEGDDARAAPGPSPVVGEPWPRSERAGVGRDRRRHHDRSGRRRGSTGSAASAAGARALGRWGSERNARRSRANSAGVSRWGK